MLYLGGKSKKFWILFFVIIGPFIFELLAQLGRFSLSGPSLDGPSRFLLAGFTFIYLASHDWCPMLINKFSMGSLISIPITFASVIILDDYYWLGRAATRIMCPNTLPVYLSVLSCFAFYFLKQNRPTQFYLFFISLVLMSGYILYLTKTRTSWVAVIILISTLFLLHYRLNKVKLLISNVGLFCGVLFFYFSSESVAERVDTTFDSIIQFYEGSPNTSLGMRMGLILLDIEIVKMYPFFGLEDGLLPTFDKFKEKIPILTNEIYELKRLPGSHSEITANLTRKGIILGLFALFCLFIYPMKFFVSRLFDKNIEVKKLAMIGISVVVIILISSFGTQVFHFKMTSTFWGYFLAMFFASIFRIEKNIS